MIIDALTALPSIPTTGDELPIERGTTTYKIDYDALETAIINKMTPSISTSFTFEEDVVGLGNQCFAMKQGKVVVLSCGFKITANKSGYTKLATLPSGFWPTQEIEFISVSYYGPVVYAMYITNQGELYCRNGINATNMLVFNVAYIQV